jgi:WD40 repeat protein
VWVKPRQDGVGVWDAVAGREVRFLDVPAIETTDLVALSADGRRLAVGSAGRAVRVWDAATGKELASLPDRFRSPAPYPPLFSPDGEHVAVATSDGAVRLYRAATGERVRTFKEEAVVPEMRLGSDAVPGEVTSIAFHPEGRYLAAAGSDGTVSVWDVATGGQAATLKEDNFRVNYVAFNPNGRQLAAASLGGTMRFWDTATWEKTLSFKENT